MRLIVNAFMAVVLLVLAGCSGGSDTGDEAAAPAVTAGPGTGDTLVHGVVTRDGKPVEGADVWLTLWPEDTSDIEEGDTVDTWDSPPVETGEDGSYVLRLAADTVSSRYFGGEYLNFDLKLEESSTMASWSWTVDLIDERLWRTDEDALAGDSVARMDLDLAAPSITTTDSFGEADTQELPLMTAP